MTTKRFSILLTLILAAFLLLAFYCTRKPTLPTPRPSPTPSPLAHNTPTATPAVEPALAPAIAQPTVSKGRKGQKKVSETVAVSAPTPCGFPAPVGPGLNGISYAGQKIGSTCWVVPSGMAAITILVSTKFPELRDCPTPFVRSASPCLMHVDDMLVVVANAPIGYSYVR